MKKRMTAILLTIAMLCTLLPAAVLPASAEVVLPPDEFGENTVSGTCGEHLTWTLDLDTGAMKIDGTGEMTEFGDFDTNVPWNDYRDKIRTVVIGNGVTSISDHAFFQCDALTDVTVGSSVERIGIYAFGYAPALASVSLPDSLRIIEEGAFSDCTALCDVNLPDGVTSIGNNSFQSCPLAAEELPASLETIGTFAFAYCTELEISSLPAKVKTVGAYAFRGCTGLSEMLLPDGVETVGAGAFGDCTSLNSINFPDSVTSIGFFALTGTAFYNNEANWTGDVLYVGNCLIDVKDTISGDCAIREGTRLIADNAFSDCTALSGIAIPASVTGIGERAFADCKALRSMTIPETVTSIGASAFSGSGLVEIHVPGSVGSIDRGTFDHCYSLERVTIGEGVTSIGSGAFQAATKLKSIAIPAGLTNVEAWAFNNCDNLKVVRFYGTEAQWDAITIGEYNWGLLNADVCFAGGPVITGTCKENLQWTLDTETGLLEITGTGAMCGFDLSSDIAPWYDDRDKIQSVHIGDSVGNVGSEAFRGYTKLQELTLSGSVTSIGWWSFAECTGLTGLRLPEGVAYIGLGAFRGCTGLTSVTIPNSVEEIDSGAFLDCTALSDVYYYGTEKEWGAITINMENECLTEANIHFLGSCEHEHAHPEHKDATCTDAGYDKMICDDCGEVLSEEVIPVLGHDLIDHAAQAPTCTEIGWEAYQTCSRCDYTTYAEIPALGHDLVTDPAKAATCTEAGLTEGQHCTRCDYKVAQETVPALGHSWDDGKITTPATETTDGVKTFTCTRCGETKTEKIPATGGKTNPFGDVKEGDFYYDAVLWAVNAQPQVTAGTSTTTFSPNDTCTRAQVVTFLWRAKGCPEPKSTNNPFTDVKGGEYYYKAVLWAVENNITAGTSATTFSPNAGCTRAQVVTFLWRTEGQPKPTSSANPFKDVKGGYYYDAVLWAVEKKITAGTSATTFSPDNTCTRGQIVTFLYRAFAE